jgi:hypothetical protein
MILDIKGDKKSIPAKYTVIKDIENYIDDIHHRRITPTERKNLDIQLIRTIMAEFTEGIKNTPGLRDIINIAEPMKAMKITTKYEIYYAIRFANGKEVRCKYAHYNSSPIKEEIKRLY